ncbi:dynein heavy chain [Sugiyamaella lignohabitans]|uniref:Dynein heavy chain n=1 Tax=Sugiyamaella lignohabitans TaxID=796027 RepID=A0A167FIQ8_9ASCO|nr:dynein heavy chain [Sugiyamaella lignohabitans]ANB15354.1 dynein heavy chain [Sugiyamaella lignohabitans]
MGSSEGLTGAEKAIQIASKDGSWVVLQNLHLSPDWIEGLEKLIESLQAHHSFRLFFTISLAASVPVTLLRTSRILTFERAAGIQSSMRQSLEGVSAFDMSKLPVERARLYYLLSWVHSIIVERLNFVPLGWSKTYAFNASDFESGLFVIDKWIDDESKNRTNISPSAIPWKALRTLIINTVYGGKIDISDDEIKTHPIVNRAFSKDAYSLGYELVEGESLSVVPEENDRESIFKWIDRLPERESPRWLGLEEDAEESMMKILSK